MTSNTEDNQMSKQQEVGEWGDLVPSQEDTSGPEEQHPNKDLNHPGKNKENRKSARKLKQHNYDQLNSRGETKPTENQKTKTATTATKTKPKQTTTEKLMK